MKWIAVFAGVGVVLLITGLCVEKRALKMKAQGKENLRLYVAGWAVMTLGISLLVMSAVGFVFGTLA